MEKAANFAKNIHKLSSGDWTYARCGKPTTKYFAAKYLLERITPRSLKSLSWNWAPIPYELHPKNYVWLKFDKGPETL